MPNTVRLVMVRALIAVALASYSQAFAQSLQAGNLSWAESFCLHVSIQSSVPGVQGRDNDLKAYLLSQATQQDVPVEDCRNSSQVTQPVLTVVALALPAGYSVSISADVSFITVGTYMMIDVTIWHTSTLGTGPTDYVRIRDAARYVFEELVLEWRLARERESRP